MKRATHTDHSLPKKYGMFYIVSQGLIRYTIELFNNIKPLDFGTLLVIMVGNKKRNENAQHDYKMEGQEFIQQLELQQTVKYGIILYTVATLLTIPADICSSAYQAPTYEHTAFTPSLRSELVQASIDQMQMSNSEAMAEAVRQEIRDAEVRAKLGPFHSHILQASQAYEVDIALIWAIIMAESGHNPRAVSYRGAQGLMQLMPTTAKWLGVEDAFDPALNIDGGVRYFKRLLDRFDGDIELALAAYNAGSRYVRNYGGVPPFKATRIYIKKVLRYRQMFHNEMALSTNTVTMS